MMTLSSFVDCARQKEEVAAVIGSRKITVSDFSARFQSIRQKMNLPDNGQVREQIFRQMIEEELLIHEAERRGYHRDARGAYEHERLQIQELLDLYLEKVVFEDLKIHEEEIRTLYIRLNTQLKARHLYAASRKEADSLYNELMRGKTFETLAKDIFTDPRLRDTGGDLGYFTADEMDPFFEDAAFALNVGQISRPVRTAQGYSIIQLEDRKVKPLLTESEYLRVRSNLTPYCRIRKMKTMTRSVVDSLRRELKVSFDSQTVHDLFPAIQKELSALSEKEGRDLQLDDGSLNHRELCHSALGTWTVKTCLQYTRYTSDEQLRWIRNEENLEDFIAGMVVRAFLLSRARELKLDKSVSCQNAVRQKMDDYLLRRMEQKISDEIVIPEDSLRTYYQENTDRFMTPPKIHLSEIVCDREDKASQIKKSLLNHQSFETLAKEHSVRRWSGEQNGDIGFFTSQELGPYAENLFSLEKDQWTGPIQLESRWVFFKCIGKASSKARTYEESREDVDRILKPLWKRKVKQGFVKSIQKHVNTMRYPEKIKTIPLN